MRAEQEGEGDFVFDVDTVNGSGPNEWPNSTANDLREVRGERGGSTIGVMVYK